VGFELLAPAGVSHDQLLNLEFLDRSFALLLGASDLLRDQLFRLSIGNAMEVAFPFVWKRRSMLMPVRCMTLNDG
jgi:hypothetical protein